MEFDTTTNYSLFCKLNFVIELGREISNGNFILYSSFQELKSEIEAEIIENLCLKISPYYYHAHNVIENLKNIVHDSILKKLTVPPNECSINESILERERIKDYDLDPFQIVIDIKKFLDENKINEATFYQKILQTTYLSFKILMNYPHEWSKLNQIFKLYYKRAFVFLNNQNDKYIFINRSNNHTDSIDCQSEQGNFIDYDISQELVNEDDSKLIIRNVVKKLRVNHLTRKCFCDAILGIPLNTFSFFSNRAKKSSFQTNYAKEIVLRMKSWYNDCDGVDKLLEWKKKYYSSQIVKPKSARRSRHCITKKQSEVLIAEYGIHSSLTKERLNNLVKTLKLDEKTIKTWFRNRRCRHDKCQKSNQ